VGAIDHIEPADERRSPSQPLKILPTDQLLDLVRRSLEDDKAIEPVVIPLEGKTDIADWMVVATGTSSRHITSMAEKLLDRMKQAGHGWASVEGLGDPQANWVLIDAGDVIVHLFRAEARALYDIEKLWSLLPPTRVAAAGP
jgi:ribosome-associated protein